MYIFIYLCMLYISLIFYHYNFNFRKFYLVVIFSVRNDSCQSREVMLYQVLIGCKCCFQDLFEHVIEL